jgi:hypothetical protein
VKNTSSGNVPSYVGAADPQRYHDAEQRQHRHRAEQDAERRHRLQVVALFARVQQIQPKQIAQAQHVEEKRTVVGRRVDAERIGGDGGGGRRPVNASNSGSREPPG